MFPEQNYYVIVEVNGYCFITNKTADIREANNKMEEFSLLGTPPT